MKLLYTNENPTMVGYARGMLENAGIAVIIKNEHLGSVLGQPYSINVELWLVNEADYHEAMRVLAPLLEDQ